MATKSLQYEKMAAVIKSMAHPMRMHILLLLDENEELTVSDLIEAMGVRQTAISQHLQKMKLHGLLGAKRRGKFIFYHLKDRYLIEIIEILKRAMID